MVGSAGSLPRTFSQAISCTCASARTVRERALSGIKTRRRSRGVDRRDPSALEYEDRTSVSRRRFPLHLPEREPHNLPQLKSTERLDRREKAILVGVLFPNGDYNADDPLDEIRGLAKTAGLVIVGSMLQRRAEIDVTTYIGSGKVGELKSLVEANEADLVIFDNDLGTAQTRNLEKALDVKVIDRTEVILDIFATRVRTHEAHLQVELAQLEYALPRLKRMWTHLSRYKGGIGVRGPGEKQLEEDKRLVTHRIQDLKRKLSKVQNRQGTGSGGAPRRFRRIACRVHKRGKEYVDERAYGRGCVCRGQAIRDS